MRSIFIKVFAKGFFKKYTKVLLFGFGIIISYCFFTQTAGALKTGTSDYWSMLLPIKVLTDPILAGLFCFVALLYSGLAARYIVREMAAERNLFLRYSFIGIQKTLRWKTWVATVFIIQLPLYLYALYSLAVGYHHAGLRYGLFILTYLIALHVGIVTYVDRTLAYGTSFRNTKSATRLGPLPLGLIPLVNHVHHNKISLILTKAVVLVALHLFADPLQKQDFQLLVLLALILSCLNIILLYRDFVLQSQQMAFALNLPYKTFARFIEPVPYYLILISPEIIYATAAAGILPGLGVFTISYVVFLLLLRSVILSTGNLPLRISKVLLFCFFTGLLFILYAAHLMLVGLSLAVAILLFYRFFQYSKLRDNHDS